MRYKMEPSYITEWNLIMQQKGPNQARIWNPVMYHDRAPTVRPSTAEPRKYGRNNLVNVATLWSYVMIPTRYKYEQQYDFMYYTKIWSE